MYFFRPSELFDVKEEIHDLDFFPKSQAKDKILTWKSSKPETYRDLTDQIDVERRRYGRERFGKIDDRCSFVPYGWDNGEVNFYYFIQMIQNFR